MRYGKFLSKFSIDLLRKYPQLNYLLIGSGLDDDISARELILNEIKGRGGKISFQWVKLKISII